MTRPVDRLSRRRVLGMGLGAGGALMLSACGDSGPPAATGEAGGGDEYTGPPVSLDFWNGFTGGDGPFMETLVDEFNEEHDNIDVTMTVYQWGDYYQKLPAAVSTGSGPDVGIMHVDSLATNAARNVLQPLDDVADALGLGESDFAAAVWAAGVYQDERYGIPLDVHPLGFFYNKTVLAEAGLDPDAPPETADDYAEALEALQAAGIEGHWMTPFPFTGAMTFYSLLWQFGGSLFNEDVTAAAYHSDAGVQALTWMVDLVRDGHSPPDVAQDADMIAWQNDQTAFNWNGIWQVANFQEVNGLEWGVGPLPQIGTERAAWAGSHNFVLLRQRRPDDNKLAAAKVFINSVSQRSLEWAKGGQVPARRTVREDPAFQELTEQAALAEQIDYLHFPPAVPGIGDAMATVEAAINEAVLLQAEPAEALAEAAGRADRVLEENRQRYDG